MNLWASAFFDLMFILEIELILFVFNISHVVIPTDLLAQRTSGNTLFKIIVLDLYILFRMRARPY